MHTDNIKHAINFRKINNKVYFEGERSQDMTVQTDEDNQEVTELP